MDILYLLIPLSAVLVLGILVVFAWALKNGQFDDLEHQGSLILDLAPAPLDDHQAGRSAVTEQSSRHGPGATTENS